MTDNNYEAIKKIMDNKELSNEMEKIHPGIKAQMAGYLLSPWLPQGIIRKLIMVLIALVAFGGGFIYEKSLFYLLFLIIPIFSPRIIGEVFLFIGRIARIMSK